MRRGTKSRRQSLATSAVRLYGSPENVAGSPIIAPEPNMRLGYKPVPPPKVNLTCPERIRNAPRPGRPARNNVVPLGLWTGVAMARSSLRRLWEIFFSGIGYLRDAGLSDKDSPFVCDCGHAGRVAGLLSLWMYWSQMRFTLTQRLSYSSNAEAGFSTRWIDKTSCECRSGVFPSVCICSAVIGITSREIQQPYCIIRCHRRPIQSAKSSITKVQLTLSDGAFV
jgi:hypothetical protein